MKGKVYLADGDKMWVGTERLAAVGGVSLLLI